ncbi:MAG: [protein-PII] uridylyltransferase [Pseudohongiellaceae bacterium]
MQPSVHSTEPDTVLSPDEELLSDTLRGQLTSAEDPVKLYRNAIEHAKQVLDERYRQNVDIVSLVTGRAWFIDQIIKSAWQRFDWPDEKNISLLAVGGYGRGELHPHSDVDIMILTRGSRVAKYKASIAGFSTFLWDIGLEIGQSVRSIKQCKQEAQKDITVATTLMESRTIVGSDGLRADMHQATTMRSVWPIKAFFKAKRDEQIARHRKFHDIDYALEPNVKSSPGGLRDIQTIAWVARRHFGAVSFHDLVELGFLKPFEEAQILEGQRFLWRIRYGLHLLDDRREDRLLFDKQRELAKLFGFKDDDRSLGVEKLMQQYYRTVATLREVNDVLLQHFDEVILRQGEREKITLINKRFQIRNGYIEARSAKVFGRFPFALLEIFVQIAQNPEIEGVRASTIRLIRENRHLIDEAYRHDIRNVSLFMELLRSPHQLAMQLRRMARYGILDRYLPEFGQITGKMQHDLFHIYTVDAHTLQVVENMRRFRLPGAEEEFPVASHIVKNLPKVELLYIAGLYHDIAKGRGGDHSTLGMEDARSFCQRHHLSAWDTNLVCWLVNKHLLMSMTAQRKDIADPDVIHEFATQMGDKLHLDYLYTMTVADICATNPNLWNAWRASLLRQLYTNTKRALRQGLENPVDRDERISDKQQSAMVKLRDKGLDEEPVLAIWDNASDEYFLRESASNIVWHTEAIAAHSGEGPLISIKNTGDHSLEGATQVFIFMPNTDYLFANSTAAFEKLNLNIQGARIFTSSKSYCMDTYTVLEADGKPVANKSGRLKQIREVLEEFLTGRQTVMRPANIRIQRRVKSFSQHVETRVINNSDKPYSTLEINCPDQPGILACVGKIFVENDINLLDARITTLGERVEDLFYITDKNDEPLRDEAFINELESDIKQELEQRFSKQLGKAV